MKAMTRNRFGGPEVLQLTDIAMPVPGAGTVLLQVRAFGLNHAELYMRKGEWGNVAAVSGIECVGSVVEDPAGRLQPGQTVMALMGGMGRSINGSYAEYTLVPAANVVPLETTLPWETLAALPESYAVAWTCLHRNLQLKKGQRLVVRGGTSSLGQAAIDLAVLLGAEVIATTRHPDRAPLLQALGAKHVAGSAAALAPALAAIGGKADAVLDLLGNSTVLDSMAATRRGGHVCLAGFLAGLAPLDNFNPISQMASGVQLSFFGSFNFGDQDFPLSDIPMQQIVDAVADGSLRGRPARVFEFAELPAAHALMERNQANGKLVVVV